jgi:hypothetical protein
LLAIWLQDVLGLKLNRVTLAAETAGLPPGASLLPQHQKKSYDVDDKDFFWEAAGALPFPKVGIFRLIPALYTLKL